MLSIEYVWSIYILAGLESSGKVTAWKRGAHALNGAYIAQTNVRTFLYRAVPNVEAIYQNFIACVKLFKIFSVDRPKLKF